jgi:cystathionine beta-lyase/cystathionine gamma-synthase
MAALSLATLTYLAAGDHVVVSDQLYGRSLQLLTRETARHGVRASLVDTCKLEDVQAAVGEQTRLIVVETISNPMLRVADIGGLADIARGAGAQLLVDNTFASPCVCRPLDLGADLVLESLSKMMNGHSDVMLGMLCGQSQDEHRLRDVLSVWGLASSPFDCWLALRGMSTLHLRMDRACATAAHVATLLARRDDVLTVHYPGLACHPDRSLAEKQFAGGFGNMVTFSIPGGRGAAERFMKSAGSIEFCPSLGEISTTISHPASTSHRSLTGEQQRELGIEQGTLRLSVGTESTEFVTDAIQQGLDAVGNSS